MASSLDLARFRAFHLVFFLGMSLFFGRQQARAEDAEEFVKRGIELRRQAKDSSALVEFKKAWAIDKTSRIEAQMALAEQALGLWVIAEEHLLDALGPTKNDAWTKKNRATLTKALTVIQSHLGTLEIWGTPAGAAIFVNEKPIGALPLDHPLRIADESVVVRARAEGFLEWTRTVRVDAGQAVRQNVEMVPSVPARALTPPSVVPRDTGQARTVKIRSEDLAPPPEDAPTAVEATPKGSTPEQSPVPGATDQPARQGLRPYAWTAGAGALLALGLGALESLAAHSKTNQFNGLAECGTRSLTDQCKTIKADHDRAITLATVGYISGGGLAVLSGLLFILSSGNENAPASVAHACAGDVTLPGVSCGFAF